MDCSMSGSLSSHSLLEFAQIHAHYVNDVIQLCQPLLPSSPPAFSLSQHHGLFKWVSIRWPKYQSFSFSIRHYNEYSMLISFRIDWFDLLAVQGTLKSLLHHHSSKASVLWCPAVFMVQLSHLYMTMGKTIALTRQTFVSKAMSLLFNILSRLAIAFLPKRVFNFMAAVTICSDFGAQENKVCYCSFEKESSLRAKHFLICFVHWLAVKLISTISSD